MIFHLNNRRKEKLESFVLISIIIIIFPFFYTLVRYAGALQWQCSSAPFSTVNKICFLGQLSTLYTFFGCPWNESFFLVPEVLSTNMDTLYTLLSNAFQSKFVIFCTNSKGGLIHHPVYIPCFILNLIFRSDSIKIFKH